MRSCGQLAKRAGTSHTFCGKRIAASRHCRNRRGADFLTGFVLPEFRQSAAQDAGRNPACRRRCQILMKRLSTSEAIFWVF
jgi:hypothetical protein